MSNVSCTKLVTYLGSSVDSHIELNKSDQIR